MSCKFKRYLEKCTAPNCDVIWGECQFIKEDGMCPIKYAYKGEEEAYEKIIARIVKEHIVNIKI